MTDKVQKIREKVEKLRIKNTEAFDCGCDGTKCAGYNMACDDILSFIDSMQEEPVSEDLEKASKEWLRPQLDKSYANYGEAKMMELTHFDGYAMLDAIDFGAKWQKQQMMAKAIDAEVKVDAGGYPYIPQMELYDYDKDIPLAKEGDKYMVVLIKEE